MKDKKQGGEKRLGNLQKRGDVFNGLKNNHWTGQVLTNQKEDHLKNTSKEKRKKREGIKTTPQAKFSQGKKPEKIRGTGETDGKMKEN